MISAAVVLAAGANRRMGAGTGPKALLPLTPAAAGGESFLSRAIRLYTESGVEEIVVVVSAGNRDAVAARVGPGVELVTVDPGPGPSGSTVSMEAGLRAVLRRHPDGTGTLVADADIVFERAVPDRIAGLDGPALLTIDRIGGDDEEVRVYGRSPAEPVLIGKGLPPAVTGGLELLGESLGMIVLDAPAAVRTADVAAWIVGAPPNDRPYGFSGRCSEHEEVWQYLFALRSLPVLRLDGDLLFSECDVRGDLDRIRDDLYPAVLVRDGAPPRYGTTAADDPPGTGAPLLIVLAGADGVGKSTLTRSLAAALATAGRAVRVVDRWDIVGDPAYPAARFLADDVPDIRRCVADMPGATRLLFLVWSMGMALQARVGTAAPADEILVVDGYWMKHAASEIVYGQDRCWAEAVVAPLPVPDLTVRLSLDPAAAWRRKDGDLVPYECGMDPRCGRDGFLRHQRAIGAELDAWTLRYGWPVIDAGRSPAAVLADLTSVVAARLAIDTGAR